MKKILKVLTSRLLITAILVIVQFAFVFYIAIEGAHSYQIETVLTIMSFLCVIYVINGQDDPSYKIAWSILILAFPIIGLVLFLICFGRKMPKSLAHGTIQASKRMKDLLEQDETTWTGMNDEEKKMFHSAMSGSEFPAYDGSKVKYYGSGEEWYPEYLEELKKAKHFIFMEYFIVDRGTMWADILEILKQKAQEGVEIKLVYDDFGSITLPYSYTKYLTSLGIEAYRFNPVRAAMLIQMNNRDHRKITVVDNAVAFTGGVNIADEYINRISRFGYWRDSAVKVEGKAVWSFTMMFLGMFSYLKKNTDTLDYEKYHLPVEEISHKGYYQPFSDTPTDDYDTSVNMHLNMINRASKYLYIETPYLVLPNDIRTALCLAAQNGVDVRILTPHVPDKKMVFEVTRGNYYTLTKYGVKVYEFTPGFNHTKLMFSDDRWGIAGSVNTDYRSYYLHFENGILLEDEETVAEMRSAFEHGLEQAQEVTFEDCKKVNIIIRVIRAIIYLMAPLF